MIQKLGIRNHKSHLNTELELKNLNILTGINRCGKEDIFNIIRILSYKNSEIKFIGNDMMFEKEELLLVSDEKGLQEWKFENRFNYSGKKHVGFNIEIIDNLRMLPKTENVKKWFEENLFNINDDEFDEGIERAVSIVYMLMHLGKNCLLLIKNPETNLHPKIQHLIAKLIAETAHSGLQIILETNSDHILNGILVASKQFELEGKGINKDLVKIFNFEKGKIYTLVDIINVLPDARIDKQPKDFFEQTEIDLRYILGF